MMPWWLLPRLQSGEVFVKCETGDRRLEGQIISLAHALRLSVVLQQCVIAKNQCNL